MRRPLGVDERHIPVGTFVTEDELQAALDALPDPGGSDGSPPASSPAPEVVGLPGALHVKWDPVTNADPVTYKVYVVEA